MADEKTLSTDTKDTGSTGSGKLPVIKRGDLTAPEGRVETYDEWFVRSGETEANSYMKMKYQEKQFLRAQDFIDEQKYHERKLMDHNRAMHEFGVCEGLLVRPSIYDGCVDVSKGSAIDIDGRSITLDGMETLDLTRFCTNKDSTYITPVMLFIGYDEADASDPKYNMPEGGFTGCTRKLEQPMFKIYPSSEPSADAKLLLLAKIGRDAKSGKIQSPDNIDNNPPGRRTAGVKLGIVDSDQLTANSVKTEHLADGAVTSGKLATGAAIANIAAGTIDSTKLKAGAAVGNITSGTVTAAMLATGAALGNIAAGTIDSTKLKAGAAVANIEDRTLIGTKLIDGTVTNSKFSDNTLSGTRLMDGTIVSGKLAYGAAVGNIADYALSGAKLADGSVTTNKIANKAVTGSKIDDKTITIDKIRHSFYCNTPNVGSPVQISFSKGHQGGIVIAKYNSLAEARSAMRPHCFRFYPITSGGYMDFLREYVSYNADGSIVHCAELKNTCTFTVVCEYQTIYFG